MGAHEERPGEEVISKRVRGVSVEATKMNYLRAENNCTKARMIPAHSDRLIAMAIRIPFKGLEKAESSTNCESISIGSLMGLRTSGSSSPQAITFSVLMDIVIHPLSVIVI